MDTSNIWQLTPQFWSLIWVVVSLVVICIIIYFIFRKSDPSKPPNKKQVAVERAFQLFDETIESTTESKLKKWQPYLLMLFLFIFSGSLITLFGFEAPQSSIFFTLSLALVSFVGIFIIGISANGLWGFAKEKYKNPLELFSQFGPLLSLSIRLFGSTFAFAMLFEVIPLMLESMVPPEIISTWPLIATVYEWLLTGADLALSFIQAFVFVVLTSMYWRMSMGEELRRKKLAKKYSPKNFEKKILDNYNKKYSDKFKSRKKARF